MSIIKNYRQLGTNSVPNSLEYGVLGVNKKGEIFVGDESGKAVKVSSTAATATLTTAWTGTTAPFTQTVTVNGVTTTNNITISNASTATAAQLEAFGAGMIVPYSQGTNTVTFRAYGEKPTISLPVTVLILG